MTIEILTFTHVFVIILGAFRGSTELQNTRKIVLGSFKTDGTIVAAPKHIFVQSTIGNDPHK